MKAIHQVRGQGGGGDGRQEFLQGGLSLKRKEKGLADGRSNATRRRQTYPNSIGENKKNPGERV